MHRIPGGLIRRHALTVGVLAAALLACTVPTYAQDAASQPAPATPAAGAATPSPEGDAPAPGDANRIFGVMPNYTTVEGTAAVKPVTGFDSFKMAALDSFDPFVYPLFGFIAGVAQVQDSPPEWGRGLKGFGKRYGAAFADNTVCSLVTTGLMPTLLKQDPRYYQGRAHGFFNRLAYAASRSAVTKSRTTGRPQFNLSEIGGTLIVANVSNLYYPEDERTKSDTLTRWGTQTMWDTVANELKEFWPDIRHGLHWK